MTPDGFGMVSTIRNAARFRLAERLTARIIRVFSGKGPCVSEKTPMQESQYVDGIPSIYGVRAPLTENSAPALDATI